MSRGCGRFVWHHCCSAFLGFFLLSGCAFLVIFIFDEELFIFLVFIFVVLLYINIYYCQRSRSERILDTVILVL